MIHKVKIIMIILLFLKNFVSLNSLKNVAVDRFIGFIKNKTFLLVRQVIN